LRLNSARNWLIYARNPDACVGRHPGILGIRSGAYCTMLAIAMGYRLVRGVIRLLLWLFYRRVDVVGADRVPTRGSLIIAANHHNSIVDPMLIMGTFPRRITALANAPLFHHPVIGPFLHAVGALPVHRRAEAGDDPRKNEAMFATAFARLRAGGAILIFPEGRTQPVPKLLPLRTGAARLLLGAEADGGRHGVTLLPVGLVFEKPGTFRAASALVAIGAPVDVADCVAGHAAEPEATVRRLTERLAGAMRAQIVEAEDQHTLDLLRALERAWREERRAGGADAGASLAWRREVMRAAHALADRAPDRVAAFRRRLEIYRARLGESGLTDAELGRPYTPAAVARWLVTNAVSLGIMLPLALWGIASHAVPYALTRLAVAAMHRTEEEEATDKMAAGLVLYPLSWAFEGWLVERAAGVPMLVVFLLLLAPSGLVALAWRERLARVARQARAFAGFVADRRLHADLITERRALVNEAMALAELARP
jgi:glycerol-3-phosphate O-acyltransferase/dihydroxyacetone phosphate acyltransferase